MDEHEKVFAFEGHWREFAPILLTNLLLTIVTLGIYRFWGSTRERRYLWSRTRFIDDTLEWTGTGLELFIGFLVAVVIIFVPLFAIQFVVQALVLQGQTVLAGLLGLTVYLLLLFLVGIAIFRALRYRLSRTRWHGIRGGSHDNGVAYGGSYLWRTLLAVPTLGLSIPWSMSRLFAQRWNEMSFGPHRFVAGRDWSGLMKRFLLCYLVPVVAFVAFMLASFGAFMAQGSPSVGLGLVAFAVLSIYIMLPLLALAYYAAFFRKMIGQLSLATLAFSFSARTKSWLWLFIGNFGLLLLAVIVGSVIAGVLGVGANLSNPLGLLGLLQNPLSLLLIAISFLIPLALATGFARYRTWAFFIGHLDASGDVDLVALTQSDTPEPRQGEGLLDALDVGAI